MNPNWNVREKRLFWALILAAYLLFVIMGELAVWYGGWRIWAPLAVPVAVALAMWSGWPRKAP